MVLAVGKTLALFGIVSQTNLKMIKKMFNTPENGQRVLAKLARESALIVNVSRVDLVKNRQGINHSIHMA